jgi:hypothetical protein
MALIVDNKIIEFNLTGEQLELNSKSYIMKLQDGTEFFVGKLLERSKAFCYFHGSYPNYNNIFVFEYMPDNNLNIPTSTIISLCKIFK